MKADISPAYQKEFSIWHPQCSAHITWYPQVVWYNKADWNSEVTSDPTVVYPQAVWYTQNGAIFLHKEHLGNTE